MQNNVNVNMPSGYRMSHYGLLLTILLSMTFFNSTTAQEIVNDHIFHALPAARKFSDFDNKGFLINGKRTFIVSAGLEYARVPRALWRDRLLRLKRGGFNCVEVYTIWNFHEPLEGKFEFEGDKDLDYFLVLVKELGLYAIVRPGPYYCAEWDQGGYPIWLRFKPGLRVREENAEFEKYVDRFFDQLLPLVMKHQISKGGAVIMIQLENEHPKGWGTDMPDNYFRHLQNKSLAMGMEVPYFLAACTMQQIPPEIIHLMMPVGRIHGSLPNSGAFGIHNTVPDLRMHLCMTAVPGKLLQEVAVVIIFTWPTGDPILTTATMMKMPLPTITVQQLVRPGISVHSILLLTCRLFCTQLQWKSSKTVPMRRNTINT